MDDAAYGLSAKWYKQTADNGRDAPVLERVGCAGLDFMPN